MSADKLKPLLYFVHEREKIRLARLAGKPAPWTRDPILATYRFCNVRRRFDRVSTWLQNNVLIEIGPAVDYNSQALKNALLFSAWCRWVNWPPTINAVLTAGLWTDAPRMDWRKIGQIVDRLSKTEKAWTGAYMIRASKVKGAKKGAFIAQEVIGKKLAKALPEIVAVLSKRSATYQEVHTALCKVDNFGSFMAGQIAGDWTYTPLLSGALDLNTWAPMGPGSIRGFNRIVGNPKLSQRPDPERWVSKLQIWRRAIIKRMGDDYEDITALDVQNCLCETDKLLRVQNGEGRPRAKYTAHEY